MMLDCKLYVVVVVDSDSSVIYRVGEWISTLEGQMGGEQREKVQE